MRYFYDCEFIEDGHTIDLVSIGVVAEDGREFYAVSTEFDPERAGKWVRKNVLPKLPQPSSPLWKTRARIREDLLAFLIPRPSVVPELWAWVAAYDHVALCQLWGPMTALPQSLPRFTRELKQFWEENGSPALPAAPDDAHDALADARHNLVKFETVLAARSLR
ncbi:MAG: polyadenylate-specific 3'-exoribonuclease AS [Rhodococcus sp.]|nr:polyadenylate-specific 3'-exoribonuclease AS [Rhodococcus sp. (in: high G+C Gram-positive bacteria)]